MPLREYLQLIRHAAAGWYDDNAPSMGAALAFYSAFALAPLLIILSAVAGMVFGAERGRRALLDQARALLGPIGSQAVQHLIEQGTRAATSLTASAIGLLLLLIGASSVMVELQQDLDRILKVTPRRHEKPYLAALWGRLAAFALVLAFGLLLLVSLIVGIALNALAHRSQVFAAHSLLIEALHLAITLVVFSLLFAMLFKWLPSARLHWHDVWRGAFVTALLFTAGQQAIGYYLGRSTTTSVYAAAASVLVLLLWLYYAAQIFLFGAELVWASVHRRRLRP